MTLVNWGLFASFVGAFILVVASIKANLTNAFREKNGHVEVNAELLKKASHQFIQLVMWGFILVGVGTLMQIAGNIVR